jgi:hypothetical protein
VKAWTTLKMRTHLSNKREKYTNIVTSQNDLFYFMGNLTRKPIWDRRIEFFLVEAARAQTFPVLRFLI